MEHCVWNTAFRILRIDTACVRIDSIRRKKRQLHKWLSDMCGHLVWRSILSASIEVVPQNSKPATGLAEPPAPQTSLSTMRPALTQADTGGKPVLLRSRAFCALAHLAHLATDEATPNTPFVEHAVGDTTGNDELAFRCLAGSQAPRLKYQIRCLSGSATKGDTVPTCAKPPSLKGIQYRGAAISVPKATFAW